MSVPPSSGTWKYARGQWTQVTARDVAELPWSENSKTTLRKTRTVAAVGSRLVQLFQRMKKKNVGANSQSPESALVEALTREMDSGSGILATRPGDKGTWTWDALRHGWLRLDKDNEEKTESSASSSLKAGDRGEKEGKAEGRAAEALSSDVLNEAVSWTERATVSSDWRAVSVAANTDAPAIADSPSPSAGAAFLSDGCLLDSPDAEKNGVRVKVKSKPSRKLAPITGLRKAPQKGKNVVHPLSPAAAPDVQPLQRETPSGPIASEVHSEGPVARPSESLVSLLSPKSRKHDVSEISSSAQIDSQRSAHRTIPPVTTNEESRKGEWKKAPKSPRSSEASPNDPFTNKSALDADSEKAKRLTKRSMTVAASADVAVLRHALSDTNSGERDSYSIRGSFPRASLPKEVDEAGRSFTLRKEKPHSSRKHYPNNCEEDQLPIPRLAFGEGGHSEEESSQKQVVDEGPALQNDRERTSRLEQENEKLRERVVVLEAMAQASSYESSHVTHQLHRSHDGNRGWLIELGRRRGLMAGRIYLVVIGDVGHSVEVASSLKSSAEYLNKCFSRRTVPLVSFLRSCSPVSPCLAVEGWGDLQLLQLKSVTSLTERMREIEACAKVVVVFSLSKHRPTAASLRQQEGASTDGRRTTRELRSANRRHRLTVLSAEEEAAAWCLLPHLRGKGPVGRDGRPLTAEESDLLFLCSDQSLLKRSLVYVIDDGGEDGSGRDGGVKEGVAEEKVEGTWRLETRRGKAVKLRTGGRDNREDGEGSEMREGREARKDEEGAAKIPEWYLQRELEKRAFPIVTLRLNSFDEEIRVPTAQRSSERHKKQLSLERLRRDALLQTERERSLYFRSGGVGRLPFLQKRAEMMEKSAEHAIASMFLTSSTAAVCIDAEEKDSLFEAFTADRAMGGTERMDEREREVIRCLDSYVVSPLSNANGPLVLLGPPGSGKVGANKDISRLTEKVHIVIER